MTARAHGRIAPGTSWRWPLAVAGLLSLHASLCLVALGLASIDPSFAVEPGYYEKAVAWDAAREARAASDRLGWSVRLAIGPRTGLFGDRRLELRIAASGGTPVDAGRVTAVLFAHARARHRVELDLVREASGRYATSARMPRGGTWELRLAAERGADRFVRTLVVEVPDRAGVTVPGEIGVAGEEAGP